MMVATATSSREGTAHPPIPRQPTMREWLKRHERKTFWQRIAGKLGRAA